MDLSKENMFYWFFNDGMKDAKKNKYFWYFWIKGWNESEMDNTIILDGWVFKKSSLQNIFSGVLMLASKLDPRGTPLG